MSHRKKFLLYPATAPRSEVLKSIDGCIDLINHYVDLTAALPATRGFEVRLIGEAVIRCAYDRERGFLACDYLDMGLCDYSEFFVLQGAGGDAFAGWRRNGIFGSTPPEIWVEKTLNLPLGTDSAMKIECDFDQLLDAGSLDSCYARAYSLARSAESIALA